MANFFTLFRKAIRVVSDRLSDEKGFTSLVPLLKKQDETLGDVQFVGAVYFPDAPINMYQLDQWYEIMRQLAESFPLVIITRNAASAVDLLKKGSLPVAYFRSTEDVEKWMEEQGRLRIVFYVNQNILNFQMLRFRQPAHVFISHGESDKDYMASNQLKAYDYTFIAGQAAYDRISALVHNFDVDARTLRIGRPQTDIDFAGPTLPDDDKITVFYAPTWEGDRPSMRYSSVQSHGIVLVQQLLASGRHRVIYRPHPRTGVDDAKVAAADKAIRKLIQDANGKGAAGHVVDVDSVFGWQLKSADVCIADISAVAFDWLATGKPLVLTAPENPDAIVDPNGLAGRLLLLTAADSTNIVTLVDEALSQGDESPQRAESAAAAEHYFGDTTPGASMAKFQEAVRTVVNERNMLV